MGPLAGLKVIDLTHVMAGPTCTLMLADMGADVIKIEKIPESDDTRHTPPRIGNEAASFLMMNRNKRGLALDLKRPGGAAVLHRLLASADVLVENYAPGVIERLGFGYEDLRKTYPALIYCSLSGFGRTGPYKDRRGFDLVASMAMGSAHPLNAPYQALEAADGWIVVGGANQRNWLRILEALQASHLAHDQRFLASADRMAHLKELEAELSPRFRAKSSAYWLEILDQKGVPCGPVRNMLQALADPQTIARDMVVDVPHSSLGAVKTLGLPVKFSETPGRVRGGAPLFGEHGRQILCELGFSTDDIAALEKDGAVALSAKAEMAA